MKLFTSSDIHEIDRLSIEKEGIDSLDLMERAASTVVYEIVSRWVPSQRILIFAGRGNNGGDALAVARLLIDQGYKPIVYLFNTKDSLSHDCEANKQRLLDYGYPDFHEIIREFKMPNFRSDDVVIDGLFGSGLSKPLGSAFQSLVRAINESNAYVVSIDIPSGLFGEFNRGNSVRNITHANLTLTFQFPRLSFFFANNAECIGEWKVLDIGLDREAIANTPSSYFLIDDIGVKKALRKRKPFSTKDDYGRIFMVAGSLGMMGAAVLSARAAMRAGAGAVTVHCPSCGYIAMQTAVPEVMVDSDNDQCHTTSIAPFPKSNAVAIGSGIGTNQKTIDALERFLKQAAPTKPIVLDADALNCIAKRRTMLNDIPANSIITPHAKEFDRLFMAAEEYPNDEDRFLKAVEMARFLKLVIVLKGHYTKVIRPDGKVFVNSTGNPGMATAGSGDVLTGIIASLLGQGYSSSTAATVGVYVHGLAGDLAKSKKGETGLIASDIVDNLGEAFRLIENEIKNTNFENNY